jgi:hypothetical protein
MWFVRFTTGWAFYSSPDGRRLFVPHGFGFRPYVVPDAVSEARLARRLAFVHPAAMGIYHVAVLVVVLRGAVRGNPLSVFDPSTFFGLTLGGAAGLSVVVWTALHRPVRGLARAPRLSWRTVVDDMAVRRSAGELGFVAAVMGFAAAGGLVIVAAGHWAAGLVTAVFGMYGTFCTVFALRLQSRTVGVTHASAAEPDGAPDRGGDE